MQWDAPDESAELEETVGSSVFVEDFLKTLSPTDRRIVELRMEDVTLEEIAKEVGFKTHSAVLKRYETDRKALPGIRQRGLKAPVEKTGAFLRPKIRFHFKQLVPLLSKPKIALSDNYPQFPAAGGFVI